VISCDEVKNEWKGEFFGGRLTWMGVERVIECGVVDCCAMGCHSSVLQ